MKKYIAILFIANLLLLSACSSFFRIKVLVDNPTAQTLTYTLDGKNHEIPSKSFKEMVLVKGEHEIVAHLGENEILNTTTAITSSGLLNLTQSTYVIHQDLYLLNQDDYSSFAEKALDLQDVEINGKTYKNVDFQVYEGDLLIPEDWDYGVDKELPSEIKTSSGDYEVVSKLYRIADLEKSWGFFGNYDFSTSTDIELKQFLDSIQQEFQLADTIQL